MGFTASWVRRMKSVQVFSDVTCDRCDKVVPRQSFTSEDTLQYDNILILRLEGGYGMFIDPTEAWERSRGGRRYDTEIHKILCHECAHEFAEWLGWDVHNKHTHVAAEHGGTQHPDHHDGAGAHHGE